MSEPTAPQRYLFRKCLNAECSVMIGWEIGALQGFAMCKWCADDRAHWQIAARKRQAEQVPS